MFKTHTKTTKTGRESQKTWKIILELSENTYPN